MKKILVTGTRGYIGTSFQKWISKFPEKYAVDTVSVRDEEWKKKDFSRYDVVFHAAAIVHVRESDTDRYFSINRDLTLELAIKAKKEGVKQFIFLSTMGVYGGGVGYIDENTLPNPKTPYAKSKYEAEELLLEHVSSDMFRVAILRPPIVYGKECPGNYERLAAVARKIPLFPRLKNERSMIFINNLSEFIRLLIDYDAEGLFFPQNQEYVNTTELVKNVAQVYNKYILIIPIFNWCISLAIKVSGTFGKVFGTFVYSKDMNGGPSTLINGKSLNYETSSFKESITQTEGRELY